MSFDNKFFATGAVGGVVTLWDAYTYAPISHGIGHSNDVTGTPAIPRRSPAALPKSHLCVAVAAVCVVGGRTGLQFSPDAKQLVSTGLDGNAFVWNVYR